MAKAARYKVTVSGLAGRGARPCSGTTVELLPVGAVGFAGSVGFGGGDEGLGLSRQWHQGSRAVAAWICSMAWGAKTPFSRGRASVMSIQYRADLAPDNVHLSGVRK